MGIAPPLWALVLLFGGIAYVLFMAVLGTVWLVSAVRSRWAKHPHGPACRRCGYAVRGLTSTTCPECGADLRGDGTRTPGVRRFMPTWLWACLFTLVLSYPAALLSVMAVVTGIVPLDITTISNSHWIAPRSQAYASITAWFETAGRRGSAPIKQITLRAGRHAPPPVSVTDNGVILVWSVPDVSYAIRNRAGVTTEQGGAVDLNVMLRWLQAAGVDTTAPGVEKEAQFILDQLPTMKGTGAPAVEVESLGGPFASSASSLAHVASKTPRWYPPAAAAFWIALWIAMVILRVRRMRVRARHARAPESS